MARSLLYGQRQHKPIKRPDLRSYEQLFDSLVDKSCDLPAPYRIKESRAFKRVDLRDPSVDFVIASQQGKIDGSLLIDNDRPVISLSYCPQDEDNESGLFTFFAEHLSGEKIMAYLSVPTKSQRLSLEKFGLEDFTTRYPLGWQLRSSYYFDHRSEEDHMREMARSRSVDQTSKRIITSSTSLQELLARPGGRRALTLFSANHFLYLKRPLRDLCLS